MNKCLTLRSLLRLGAYQIHRQKGHILELWERGVTREDFTQEVAFEGGLEQWVEFLCVFKWRLVVRAFGIE